MSLGRAWPLGASFGILTAVVSGAAAQTTGPATSVNQDELDFQGRTSLAIGAGARAFGMGGAFLARADDATAASWNPAGLSYLRHPEFSLVGSRSSLDSLTRNFVREVIEDDRSTGKTPDFASVTYPFRIRSLSAATQLSFQRVISFRGERTILRGPNTLLLESEQGFDVVALGLGVQVSRRVRVGATVNRWFNGFTQTRRRVEGNPSFQEVDFALSGWNINLGAIWAVSDSLNLGVAGRTPFTGQVDLNRSRTDLRSDPDSPEQLVQTSNAFSSSDVSLDFPGAVGVGASWRARSTFTVSADYTRTFWSSARIHNYFTLPVSGAPEALFESLPYPVLDGRQVNTEQLRLGGEYVLLSRYFNVPLRLGVFSDRQYFQGGDGNVPRFTGLTLGAGLLVGPVLLDVAYLRERGRYTAGLGTDVRVNVRRLYASLIYRHDTRP